MASLFPGADRRAILEKLQHMSRNGDDIVALIGPEGSGKSTVGDFFAREAAPDQIVARARASLLTSPTQLLEEMFKAFVLDFPPQGSIADLKAALQNYFVSVQKQGRSIVLVVDDAHELGDDAFNLLVRLALTENADGAFHLLLLGETQLHDMLDYTCPLKNNASQFTCLQLVPLSLEETHNYLRYRLNSVGFNQEDGAQSFPFSKKQVDKIHRLADGNPGRINAQAHSLLESPHGMMAQFRQQLGARMPSSFPRSFPRNYTIAAVALVAVLLIAFISGGNEDEVASAQRSIELPISLPSGTNSAVSDPAASQIDEAVVASVSASSDANSPSPNSPSPNSPSPDNSVAVVAPQAVRRSATPSSVADAAGSVSMPSQAGSSSVPASTPVSTPVSTPASTPTRAAPATPTPVPVITSAPPVRTASQSNPASMTSAARTASASAPATTQAGQRSRILALPTAQFTLQLLGSSSRSNVEDFVRRQANSSIYWYETRNNGNPWFVVIHGAYASRDGAQSAVTGLSAELRNLQPWIRPVSSVQAEVNAQN